MTTKTGFPTCLHRLQQGDVLLRQVETVPSHAQSKPGRAILAYGEVTGHCHEAIGDGIAMFERDGTLYLSAPNGATVTHDEHKPITVPPGHYRVGVVLEYDHFAEEARQVAD